MVDWACSFLGPKGYRAADAWANSGARSKGRTTGKRRLPDSVSSIIFLGSRADVNEPSSLKGRLHFDRSFFPRIYIDSQVALG